MQRLVVLGLATSLMLPFTETQVNAQKKKRAERKQRKQALAGQVEKTEHLRLLKDSSTDEPIALQTSVVRYQVGRKDKKKYVDLIGAVHVGESSYYRELNRLFEDYDVVLYELVAPTGTRPTRRRVAQSGGNPVSMLQGMTKDMLKLDSQLELVDYSKKNFVHADMSPEQIAARMKERGDTGFSIAMSAIADIMREANKQAESGNAQQVNPLEMLLSMNDDKKMKRLMAEQFVSSGTLDTGLGETLNRMLIQDRNAEAMKVLKRELAKGHKKIAIFYGAAHMPDFEKRLQTEHRMKKKQQSWLTAWDLTGSATQQKAEDPFQALFQILNDAAK